MIDWRVKALLQKAISGLPKSAELNYLLQRYVAHTVPYSQARLRVLLQRSRDHLARFEEFGEWPLGEAQFFEFGAGWDLHLPIAFFAGGVRRQITIDLRRHARGREMRHVLCQLPELLDAPERSRLESVALPAGDDLAALTSALGIDYRAPADARATGLATASVHCVTSTSVLEHVPAQDISAVLAECWRILAPGGICSFIIDPGDHFARFDRSIPSNNFLRYGQRRWSLFNPGIAYQNRLRYPDYRELFERSDFEVVFDLHRRSAFPALDRAEVHRDFRHFADDDLAISYIHVVLKRPVGTGSDHPQAGV